MVWFDNHCDPFGPGVVDQKDGKTVGPEKYDEELVALVRSLQPNAVILRYSTPLSDLRGVGNEDGTAPYPLWNVVKKGEAAWPLHRRERPAEAAEPGTQGRRAAVQRTGGTAASAMG